MKAKKHLTIEEVYELAYDQLDIANIKVDKEHELAQRLDLEWDEEEGAYLDPDIFFQKDQQHNPVRWIKGLNASGFAGCLSNGNIVDRREFPEAMPVPKNSMFGVVEPKELELID